MDNKINVPTALKAFEVIIEQGEVQEDGARLLKGITARAEYDGYTVFLSDGRVTLYIYFHNKYQIDYQQRDDFDKFVANLERLAA